MNYEIIYALTVNDYNYEANLEIGTIQIYSELSHITNLYQLGSGCFGNLRQSFLILSTFDTHHQILL